MSQTFTSWWVWATSSVLRLPWSEARGKVAAWLETVQLSDLRGWSLFFPLPNTHSSVPCARHYTHWERQTID